MRVIFTGDPVELEGMANGHGLSRTSTTIYGVTFPMGAEVDVSQLPQKLQMKLANNPHFRLAGIDAPAAPLLVPMSALKPQPAAEEEPAADGAASEADEEVETNHSAPSASRKRRKIA